MRRISLALILVLIPGLARAAEPGDLLRYIPKQADAAFIVDQPRRLIDVARTFPPLQQLFAFPAVREQIESTSGKQFLQLVSYFEKTLGHAWPELVNKLAGGGAVLGVRFEADNGPSLLVLKATDEELMRRAFQLVLDVAKQELERREANITIKNLEYRGFTGYQIGEAYAALTGPVLFISNKSESLKAGLDLFINGAQESLAATGHPAAAYKLLSGHPLSWLFINLARVHQMNEAQEAYKYPRGDPGNLVFAQGLTDVIGKSPYVAIGNYQTDDGFCTSIRMPAGRNATPDGLGLHLPPTGQPGTLPLLEPKNVLFSMSFCLDLGKLVTERERLFSDESRKQFEKSEQQLGRFLGGRKLGELFMSIGAHHRLVIAQPTSSQYTIKPEQPQPAGAFVSDFKTPAYADAMNAILRTTALVLGTQAKLKYKEESIGNVKLITYRFQENSPLAGDEGNIRFNISPCFAKVGNQFMIASTIELGREMVELLQRPEVNDSAKGSPETMRMRVYSAGGAELLKAFEDRLITQTILDRAVSSEQARKEAESFVNWIRSLGRLELDTNYGESDYKLDIRLRWKKVAP